MTEEYTHCDLCLERATLACTVFLRNKKKWCWRNIFVCAAHECRMTEIKPSSRTAILPIGEFFVRKAEKELLHG